MSGIVSGLKVRVLLVSALFLGCWVNVLGAQEPHVSKLSQIQSLMLSANENEELFLFGRLTKGERGYFFSEFSTMASPEEPWVNLHALEPAWDVRERTCGKRLLGKNRCPKSSKDLFRSSRTHIGSTIGMGVLTLGLAPILGEVSASVRFHSERFDAAVGEAIKHLEASEGRPLDALLADYDLVWRGLNAYEATIDAQIASASMKILVQDGLPGNGGRFLPEQLLSLRAQYAWRKENGLSASSAYELLQRLEDFLVRTDDLDVPADLVSVVFECPGSGVKIQIEKAECDLRHQWVGRDLMVDGEISIASWRRLIMPSLTFDLSDDNFRVEFGGGIIVIHNLRDIPLVVTNVAVAIRGRNISKGIAAHRIAPGGYTYYGGLIADGDMRRVIESATSLDPDALEGNVSYGVIIRYSEHSVGLLSKTSSLIEERALSDIVVDNVLYLNEWGELLVHMDETAAAMRRMMYLGRLGRLANNQ